ncbi:MAG TPA: protein phosphatase 2C domain-containing protein, partial [Thermoguttaceae bacterium]|nr:protein phosphatase 2C domain-containing protein [Thermoguttaceae bacterium]
MDYAAATDLGLRRANNQDNLAVMLASSQEEFQHRGHLFLVADGMGAHAAGELASKIAADEVPLTYLKHPARNPGEALRAAIEQANQKIHVRGQESEDFQGMGTTISALALLPQGAL